MHKISTHNLHMQIANDTMNYIYEFIDTDINLDELAIKFNVSKFHFHKIFKEQMGANIYETIKSIRLQKASNLLITNKSSTVTQIANKKAPLNEISNFKFAENFSLNKITASPLAKAEENKIIFTVNSFIVFLQS